MDPLRSETRPETADPETADPETADPETADPETGLSTEMESLKSYEEVETIMLECNKQFLKIKAKWVELLEFQKETLESEEKFKEYKNHLLEELLEIETERNVLLVEASNKIRNQGATDPCEDLLELNCALRRLSTRPKFDHDEEKTLSSSICEVCDVGVDEKPNKKFCLTEVLLDEIGHSDILMDSMQKSDSTLSAEEVKNEGSPEKIFVNEKDLETVDKEVKEAVINLHKALEEKVVAEKAFEKLSKEYSFHLEKMGATVDSSSKTTLMDVQKKPSSVQCTSGEKIVQELAAQLCLVPGEDMAEQGSDEEVYLANELEKAELEYERSRGEVIKETVNELRSWKADENEILENISTLRRDYERLLQENGEDTEVAFLILKNIDGLGSKLNVIESIVDFVKEESDKKIARLKLNFESKALAERLQLATAVKLLAQARKDPTAEAILGMLD